MKRRVANRQHTRERFLAPVFFVIGTLLMQRKPFTPNLPMHTTRDLRRVARTVVLSLAIVSLAVSLPPLRLFAATVYLVDPNTNVSSGWAATWDNSFDNPGGTPNLVNILVDEVSETSVLIRKVATFTQGPSNGLIPTIPITFQQVSAAAVGQIVIVEETITNQSGVPWTGFQMTLFQGASPRAHFNSGLTNSSAGGLGFYTAPLSNQAFGPANLTFVADGLGQGPAGSNAVIPHGSIWLPGDDSQPGTGGELYIDVQTQLGTTFTLKETPTIPEPSGMVLIAAGVVALCAIGRRRLSWLSRPLSSRPRCQPLRGSVVRMAPVD